MIVFNQHFAFTHFLDFINEIVVFVSVKLSMESQTVSDMLFNIFLVYVFLKHVTYCRHATYNLGATCIDYH